MKNKIMIATFVTLCGMATTASAGYWECVSETWDPIACALNPDNDSWAIGYFKEAPEMGTEEDLRRAEIMLERGQFRAFEDLGAKVIEGHYQQVCELSKLLDVVEESGKIEEVAEACYKEVN